MLKSQRYVMMQETPHANRPVAPRPSFNNILVPMDFSSCADCGLTYALDLARRYGATVHVLHVMGSVEGDAYSPLRYTPESTTRHVTPEKTIYDHLQAMLAEHDLDGIRVEAVLQHGGALVPTLLAYAQHEHVDLIVMGTHGRSGMKRMLTGSITEETVRRAACSVLTLHEQTPATTAQVQRILVPLDFSAHAEQLLHDAQAIAVDFGARLDLLHVVEQTPFLHILKGAVTAYDLVPDLHEQAQAQLEHLRAHLVDPKVQAELHVEDGHAAATIVSFAERTGADLIVIATQGHSGMIEHFLIGSTTERVVRAASCPVLTLKTPAPQEGAALETGEEQATS